MKRKHVSRENALSVAAAASTKGVDWEVMPPQAHLPEKLTVYVPRAAAKRLKQMALDHDKRVNDFLQEGVEMMLAKYGQPSLAEFRKQ